VIDTAAVHTLTTIAGLDPQPVGTGLKMFKKLRGLALLSTVLGTAFATLVLSAAASAQSIQPSPYATPPVPRQQVPSQPAANQPATSQPASNQPASSQAAPNQPASNQTASTPICVRLQGQLAAFDQGAADPARADQIKRTQDAIAKQQADIDRAVAQAHKSGCAGEGFFALFSALSPQCGPITSQIQGMRDNLDHMTSDLQKLQSGSDDQNGQRRALIGQLAQNNCGAQYTAAANSQGGPQGFFDALFGGGTILNANGDGAPSGTFHTVCVRTCDGYYFPISYSTAPNRFADDENTCHRLCPASDVALYSFRNPGEDMEQAVSNTGQPYTALPSAFHYRTQLMAGCSCRRPGQSWADALKNADDSSTLESGDIVVTDQNAKALSEPPKSGKPAPSGGAGQPAAGATAASPAAGATNSDATGKRAVRVVGPPFLSASQMSPQTSSH
jgi:uncharacterized protein DUF2865